MTDTTQADALRALIEKVQSGTALLADFFVLDEIAGTLDETGVTACNAHKGFLDAAKALHEALLPNRYWQVSEWDGAWTATILGTIVSETSEFNPARAWLLAILRAKLAEVEA